MAFKYFITNSLAGKLVVFSSSFAKGIVPNTSNTVSLTAGEITTKDDSNG